MYACAVMGSATINTTRRELTVGHQVQPRSLVRPACTAERAAAGTAMPCDVSDSMSAASPGMPGTPMRRWTPCRMMRRARTCAASRSSASWPHHRRGT